MRGISQVSTGIAMMAWLALLAVSINLTANSVEEGYEQSMLSGPVLVSLLGIAITLALAVAFVRLKQFTIVVCLCVISAALALFSILSSYAAAGG
jgi:hypothetical protein